MGEWAKGRSINQTIPPPGKSHKSTNTVAAGLDSDKVGIVTCRPPIIGALSVTVGHSASLDFTADGFAKAAYAQMNRTKNTKSKTANGFHILGIPVRNQ